jgi:hypothetical protein
MFRLHHFSGASKGSIKARSTIHNPDRRNQPLSRHSPPLWFFWLVSLHLGPKRKWPREFRGFYRLKWAEIKSEGRNKTTNQVAKLCLVRKFPGSEENPGFGLIYGEISGTATLSKYMYRIWINYKVKLINLDQKE